MRIRSSAGGKSRIKSATEPGTDLSFDAFFVREYSDLVRLLFAMTSRLDEAEELAQEAMVRTFERWDRVGLMESPSGYTYRTALNLHRKRLRHLRVRARWLLAVRPQPPMEADVPGVILSALASLPRGQRAALLLVEWLGLSAIEAGWVLGVSPSSVRSRIQRAKNTLRATLEDG